MRDILQLLSNARTALADPAGLVDVPPPGMTYLNFAIGEIDSAMHRLSEIAAAIGPTMEGE